MKFLLIALLFVCFGVASAQEKDTLKNKRFDYVEIPAEFSGGMKVLYKFIGKNLRYPASARRNRIEGKSLISFIVEIDGSISNITVAKGFNEECDTEAMRVISLMPKWKPGTQEGKPVRQRNYIPITFKLSR